MKKVPFGQHADIYRPDDISMVLENAVNEKNITGNNKGKKVYNVPCSFDIETTSFYRDLDGTTYSYEQVSKMTDPKGKKVKFEKRAGIVLG
jgi:hypothetical protein